jgi:hypothetical protein
MIFRQHETIKQENKAARTHGLGRGAIGFALVDVTLQFIPDLPSCLFKTTKIEDDILKGVSRTK